MTRFHDWPERLAAFLEASKDDSFPDNGCGVFCADAIEAMTGVRLSTDFPDCAAGAEASGLEEIPVKMAQRGDLVLHDQGLAIVGTNSRYAWGPADDGGLAPIPVLRCSRAWRV